MALLTLAVSEPEEAGAGDDETGEGRHAAYAGVFVADGEDAEAEGGHDDAENAESAQVTLFLFHEGVLASVRIEVLEDFLARVHAALAVDALDVAVRGGGGDEQLFGHFLLCVTQRVKGEHVHLAAGEQEVLAHALNVAAYGIGQLAHGERGRDRGWLQGGRG